MVETLKKRIKKEKQVRCDCGKLYLVRTNKGYEFKCPRCKRFHLLKYEQLIVDYFTKEEGGISPSAV
jgi:phage FluMu protein Com